MIVGEVIDGSRPNSAKILQRDQAQKVTAIKYQEGELRKTDFKGKVQVRVRVTVARNMYNV